MADRDGIQFQFGAALPAEEILARWITGCSMAMNDILLANRWLVPMLEDDGIGEPYERLYLARLGGSHLFEAANFLCRGDRFLPIRELVATLPDNAQAAYQALLLIGKGGQGEFASRIEDARNSFSHYGKLLPDDKAAYDPLYQALKAHGEDGTLGRILDTTPPITGFRALFADDVAAELTFSGDDKEATDNFVEQIGQHMALYLEFCRAALPAYIARLPEDAWDDWAKDA
jgi:hypothetical protein